MKPAALSPTSQISPGQIPHEEMASYSSWFPQAGTSSFCDRWFGVLLPQETLHQFGFGHPAESRSASLFVSKGRLHSPFFSTDRQTDGW